MKNRNINTTLISILLFSLLVLLGNQNPAQSQINSVETEPDLDLKYMVELDRLFADWPVLQNLKGATHVQLQARATEQGVERSLVLRCSTVRLGRQALGALEMRLKLTPQAEPTLISLSLKGKHLQITTKLKLNLHIDEQSSAFKLDPGTIEGEIDAKNLDLSQLRAMVPGPLDGIVDFTMKIGGTSEQPQIKSQFQGREISWRNEPIGEFTGTWNHSDSLSSIEGSLGDKAQPLTSFKLKLPLQVNLLTRDVTWQDKGEHQLWMEARGLTPQRIRPFWQAPNTFDFALDLDIKAEGTLDDFKLTGNLQGTSTSGEGDPVPVKGTLSAGSSEQSLKLNIGKDALNLNLETRAAIVKIRRSGHLLADVPLTGSWRMNLPIVLVEPFLPRTFSSPDGVIKGNIDIKGSLAAPELHGRMQTNDTNVIFLPINRRLDKLSISMTCTGNEATFDTLEASSGQGRISGKGKATLSVTPNADPELLIAWQDWNIKSTFSLALDNFPLVHPDLPVGAIKGGLESEIILGPGDVQVSVGITKTSVELTDERVPKAVAVPSNSAIHVREWLDTQSTTVHTGYGHMKLDIELRDPVVVRGEDTELTFTGRMVMDRQDQVVQVEGGLEILPGGLFQLFDNEFETRGGILSLSEGHFGRMAEAGAGDHGGISDMDQPIKANPLEPIVDVSARGKVLDSHILVRVRGPGKRPELILESIPVLPDYQILSLLILGRVDTVDDENGEVRKEAAKLVDRFHNPSLERQLFDRLGVDKVGLGFGDSASQPIVTVGKQITRRIYVETTYHHNAPPDANGRQVRVEYRLDPWWTVDTTFGDAAEGGFGIFWGTNFGGPPPPPPPDQQWGLVRKILRGDQDGDNVKDPYDLCLNKAEDTDGFEDEDGCPDSDNDGDGIPDLKDSAPNQGETYNGFKDEDGAPDVAPLQLQGLQGTIRTFTFRAGSSNVPADGRSILETTAAVLMMLPGVKVEVAGHADHIGSKRASEKISIRRANSARNFLIRSGIDKERIEVVGHGYELPVDKSETEEAGGRNRRVEIKFISPPRQ